MPYQCGMTSDFPELQTELNRQKSALAIIADFHGQISSADFNPLEHGLQNFTGYETPSEIAYHVQHVMPHSTAEFHMVIIGLSIEQLRTAMILIETQLAYERKLPPSGLPINSSVVEDQEGFTTLLQKTFGWNTLNKQSDLPTVLDQDSFFKELSDIADECTDILAGKISDSVAAQDLQQLLNKVFELRLYFADLSLKRTGAAVENAVINLDAALLLKKALDERILEPTAYIDQRIKTLIGKTGEDIASTVVTHAAIHAFLGQTHEMDHDNDGLEDFRPDTYVPATIMGITKFTP